MTEYFPRSRYPLSIRGILFQLFMTVISERNLFRLRIKVIDGKNCISDKHSSVKYCIAFDRNKSLHTHQNDAYVSNIT